MQVRCPECSGEFEFSALERPGDGGFYCPKCKQRVDLLPHGGLVGIISLLIAAGALVLLRVHTILGFLIGLPLIWTPLSLYLNHIWLKMSRTRTLQKWSPPRKTLSEWAAERQAPIELFGNQKKDEKANPNSKL
jgi:hypothetical protein